MKKCMCTEEKKGYKYAVKYQKNKEHKVSMLHGKKQYKKMLFCIVFFLFETI